MVNGVTTATQAGVDVVKNASAQSPVLVLAMLLVTGSSVYSAYQSTTIQDKITQGMADHRVEGHANHVTHERLRDALDPMRSSIDRLTTRVDTLIATKK